MIDAAGLSRPFILDVRPTYISMIDEKLARELYRPIAPSQPDATAQPVVKIPVQRFQELEQHIKNNPANAQPYEELATIYVQQNRWRDARRVLELATHHNPESETLLALYEDVRLRLARESMDVAIAKYRNYESPANHRDLDQSELELAALQFEVAEARFQRHPQQSDLLVTSAIALKRLGRIDEAIERLRHAQKFPETRANASFNLGLCLESRSQIIEALAAYRCAALYRSPAPPRELKLKALEHAVALSERSQLYDSAIRYIDIMIADSAENQESLKSKREQLLKLSIQQKQPAIDTTVDH